MARSQSGGVSRTLKERDGESVSGIDSERLCACQLVTDRLRGLRNVAQLGSAPALGAGGRRFESSHSDQLMLIGAARPARRVGFSCCGRNRAEQCA